MKPAHQARTTSLSSSRGGAIGRSSCSVRARGAASNRLGRSTAGSRGFGVITRPGTPVSVAANAMGGLLGGLGGGNASTALRVPLDFYALLHVSHGATKDSIFKSYERLVASPPSDFGFSEKAISARKSVLDTAMETLGTPVLRREYDERLQLESVDETLPRDVPHIVAGVLILLHEAGKYETVIRIGLEALKGKNAKKFQDVALVTACSMLTTATGLLESRSSLTEALDLLREAQAMMSRAGVGGSNQVMRIVERTIAEVHPRVALELVGSGEAAVRHEGVRQLPVALDEMKKGSGVDRRGKEAWITYLDRVRQLLSAEELVELYNICPAHVFSDPKELYYVSVAHLAIAAKMNDASLVHSARDLLIKADKLGDKPDGPDAGSKTGPSNVFSRRAVEEHHRRRMAHACCSLLLGDSGDAARVLGLPLQASEPIALGVDRQMVAFVKEYSRGSETLLPGMCVLVERWMNEVALMSFYKNPPRFGLNEWFENERVVRYLENMEKGGLFVRGFRHVVGMIKNFFGEKVEDGGMDDVDNVDDVGGVGAEATLVQEQKARVVERGRSAAEAVQGSKLEASFESAQSIESMVASTPAAPIESIEPIKPTPKKPGGAPLPLRTATPAPPALQTQYDSLASANSVPSFVEDFVTTEDEGENQYLRGMDLSSVKMFDEGDTPPPLNEASIATLGGEEGWFRSAYEARRVRWDRVTITSMLILAGLSASVHRAGGQVAFHRYIPALGRNVSYNAQTGTSMSKAQARALITKWQRVKADALGRQYSTGALSDVLADELAKDWAARSAEMKRKSIHYVHKKHQCIVQRVDVENRDGMDARTVVAEIRELIEVHRPDGSQPQTFPSSYSVEYKIGKVGGNQWKIVKASVLQ